MTQEQNQPTNNCPVPPSGYQDSSKTLEGSPTTVAEDLTVKSHDQEGSESGDNMHASAAEESALKSADTAGFADVSERANQEVSTQGDEHQESAETHTQGRPVPPGQQQMPINPAFFQIPQQLQDPEIKSVRSFLTAANIMGPVSLIFGGVIMSGAALICSIAAWTKMKRLRETKRLEQPLASMLMRSFKISLFIGIFALVLNCAALYINYPRIMNAINTGDVTALIPGQESHAPQSPSTGGNSSLWG